MQIQFKLIGKRRPGAESTLEFPVGPASLQEFLTAVVISEIAHYQAKAVEQPALPFLLPSDIVTAAEAGKIGFNSRYNPAIPVETQAIATALRAFEDGLYVVFINDKAAENLAETIEFKHDTTATFLRLALLSGA